MLKTLLSTLLLDSVSLQRMLFAASHVTIRSLAVQAGTGPFKGDCSLPFEVLCGSTVAAKPNCQIFSSSKRRQLECSCNMGRVVAKGMFVSGNFRRIVSLFDRCFPGKQPCILGITPKRGLKETWFGQAYQEPSGHHQCVHWFFC